MLYRGDCFEVIFPFNSAEKAKLKELELQVDKNDNMKGK